MVVFTIAGSPYVNFIKRAVAAVVIVLALRYVASNSEINIFHFKPPYFYFAPRAIKYTRVDLSSDCNTFFKIF